MNQRPACSASQATSNDGSTNLLAALGDALRFLCILIGRERRTGTNIHKKVIFSTYRPPIWFIQSAATSAGQDASNERSETSLSCLVAEMRFLCNLIGREEPPFLKPQFLNVQSSYLQNSKSFIISEAKRVQRALNKLSS